MFLPLRPCSAHGVPDMEQNLFDYLHFLPDPYVLLVDRLTEWTGQVLGVGISVLDPAEVLEEATDKVVQFQYDAMDGPSKEGLPSALKFLDMVEGLKDDLLIAERQEDKKFVVETAHSIELVKALVGINKLKFSANLQPC
jgi:hypothetical protein